MCGLPTLWLLAVELLVRLTMEVVLLEGEFQSLINREEEEVIEEGIPMLLLLLLLLLLLRLMLRLMLLLLLFSSSEFPPELLNVGVVCFSSRFPS
jgi:hypothetical protein